MVYLDSSALVKLVISDGRMAAAADVLGLVVEAPR